MGSLLHSIISRKNNIAIINQADWISSAEKLRQGYSCPIFTIADVEKKKR
jgi:hypothetical protein